LEKTNSL